MDPLLDEIEQAKVVKQWIRTYAPSIVGGVVLGLAVLYGWNAWQDYRYGRAVGASHQYTVLLDMMESEPDAAIPLALGLIADFSDTPYAFNASLLLAKIHVDAGNLDAAVTQLRWAMDNPRPPEMAHVARLRLARVLLVQEETDEALALLENVEAQGFASVYAELRGDILSKQGNLTEARAAYREALDGLTPAMGGHPILQMKYDDLASAGDSEASEETGETEN